MKRLNLITAVGAAAALLVGGGYVVMQKSHADHTEPVISMEEDVIECSIEADAAELMKGLTATDDVDGDLTDHIIVNDIRIKTDEDTEEADKQKTDTSDAETASVSDTSSVSDAADGSDTDTAGASSEGNSDTSASEASDTSGDSDTGSASDTSGDSDSGNAAATSEASDTKEFEITYVVFDSSSNAATASRTLRYTDYHAPHFAISQALRFSSASAVDLYSCLSAEDCIDGDISSQINIEMSSNFSGSVSFGTYNATLSVTNSLGDTAVLPITFEVYDAASEEELARPQLVLTDYIVYLKKGEAFHPEDYLEGMVLDNVGYFFLENEELTKEGVQELDYGYSNEEYQHFFPKSAVEIKNDVDTEKPGTYQVRYSFQHSEDEPKSSIELTVVVE